MKYLVVDETGNDIFTEEYETEEEAIKAAEYSFNHFKDNKTDFSRCKGFYVLKQCSDDPERSLDGDIIKRWK